MKKLYKMSDEELRFFAFRQAIGAAETTRFRTPDGTRGMNEDEIKEYAGAILSSITFFNKRDPRYADLFQMRPGVTSEATVYNGYTDTMEKMIERLNCDVVYVENMSLLLDVKILFFTVGVILRGKGK